jgi:hypothetical protein
MEFRNHTPFPALAFEGIDPENQPFHVLTLRQTLTWDDDGTLTYADEQAPLNTKDHYFGEPHNSLVRQESDLCHFKPYCDVIVNAMAYAPKSQPSRRFNVRLRLLCPHETLEPSAPPQGLNPMQKPSKQAQQAWLAEYNNLHQRAAQEQVLLDKTLNVTGERWFVRRTAPRRWLATGLRWASLGILRPTTWRLTRPQKTLSVPVRIDRAFGGTCRITANDPAAKRLAKRHRLKPQPQARSSGALAQAGLQANPQGCGWGRFWYLNAKRLRRIPAPQLEVPGQPLKPAHFNQAHAEKLSDETAATLIAGLGIRPKGHPERARLAGNIDESFINGKRGLPEDFDFAVWNAAWPDQQARHLKGNETLELVNLCEPDAPGVRYDRQGNTVLRLSLPQHDCFALLRYADGTLSEQPLLIDTLIVEPQAQTLSLVWRVTLKKNPARPLRAMEARMRTFAQRDRLDAAVEVLRQITRAAVSA